MQNSVYINLCPPGTPEAANKEIVFFIPTNLSIKLTNFIVAPEQLTYVHCKIEVTLFAIIKFYSYPGYIYHVLTVFDLNILFSDGL